jgi:hypothetical protein
MEMDLVQLTVMQKEKNLDYLSAELMAMQMVGLQMVGLLDLLMGRTRL